MEIHAEIANCKQIPQLREMLIKNYLGLVHYVVNRTFMMVPDYFTREDLMHIGVIGLNEALERYDPSLQVKFATFAVPRIRGAILDELRRHGQVSRFLVTKSNRIQKARAELEQKYHQDVSEAALAARLGISEAAYRQWQSQLSYAGKVSLDRPNPGMNGGNYREAIADPTAVNPLENIVHMELKILLIRLIKQLPEKYRALIFLYYYEQLTFNEIGSLLKVSESRISQMHSLLVKRLRKQIEQEVVD